MNKESALAQFDVIEKSIHRARLPFETDMANHKEIREVILWELIKSHEQLENLIREFDPERFGAQLVNSTHIPALNVNRLYLCPFCGSAECQSDHK